MASKASREAQTREQIDNDISEFGWRAVQAGDHRSGRKPRCSHQWEEVDAEPPYDICVSCGKRRD